MVNVKALLQISVYIGCLATLVGCFGMCDKSWVHVQAIDQCILPPSLKSPLSHTAAIESCRNVHGTLVTPRATSTVTGLQAVLGKYDTSQAVPSYWTDYRIAAKGGQVSVLNSQDVVVTNCDECNNLLADANVTIESLDTASLCIFIDPSTVTPSWRASDCLTGKHRPLCTKRHNGLAGSDLSVYDLAALSVGLFIFITLVVVVIASAKYCPDNVHKRHLGILRRMPENPSTIMGKNKVNVDGPPQGSKCQISYEDY